MIKVEKVKKGKAGRVYSVNKERLKEALDAVDEVVKPLKDQLFPQEGDGVHLYDEGGEMMNYAVWFKGKRRLLYFRLISAVGLDEAMVIAKDLAWRSKAELIGISPFDDLVAI